MGVGESVTDAGVEDPGTASFSGRVFIDSDDGSDRALKVCCDACCRRHEVATTTDATGAYTFTGLDAGSYRAVFPTDVDGLTLVSANIGDDDTIDSDAKRGSGETSLYVVGVGESVTDVDAGVEDPGTASFSGRVFIDSDDDDLDVGEAEQGLEGVLVTLVDADGNEVATTTTDATGAYTFTGLDAGSYRAVFPTDVDGLTLVSANIGDDDTIDSDAKRGSGETSLYVVGVGESVTDVDAGVEDPGTASFSGRVFIDSDDDDLDVGEAEQGLEGVLVTLVDAEGNEVATTTTDATGAYTFTGLDAGSYRAVFPTDVDGLTLVSANIGDDDTIDSDAKRGSGETSLYVVGVGESVTDVDAGVEDPGTASFSGRVFIDSDDDDLDVGEAEQGLEGVLVTLVDADGNEVATTTTDATGAYTFTGLDAGSYGAVFPTDVDGLTLVSANIGDDDTIDSDAKRGSGETSLYVVDIGQSVTDVDAGFEDPGTSSLAGRVFLDGNDNDVDDSEPGVGNIVVTLQDGDGNTVATTITADDGSYVFEDLDAGDYVVVFPTEVDGRVLVDANIGGDDAVDSDADPATGATAPISLGIGEDVSDVDAGIEDAGSASLSGRIFIDSDDDSLDVDEAEEGIAGQTVILLDEDGNEVASTTTDAEGAYTFTGLDAGRYKVRFPTEVDGLVLVNANIGDDERIDSDAKRGSGETSFYDLDIGENVSDVDAGLEDPAKASLAGRFFVDENLDDLEDGGDTAVSGATVELLLDGEVIATTTTNSEGAYLFRNLRADEYQVRFINPTAALGFVTPNVGGDEIVDSDAIDNGDGTATTAPVSVSLGENVRDVDAGIGDPGNASLGDFVFIDMNRNGVLDDGDVGLGGVTVTLLDENGQQIDETVSNEDGSYVFDELLAGTYSVQFQEADGFDFADANVGGDDAADSDADQATGQTENVVLGIGEENLTVDAGLVMELPPEAVADEACVCATETKVIDVLANDADPEGDDIFVSAINGQDVELGDSVTLDSGAVVTLNADGTLSYDSSNGVYGGFAADELPIGTDEMDGFTYTVSDGDGGTATSNVDVEVKGALNTVETIMASLPEAAITVQRGFLPGLAFASTVNESGDERFDGVFVEGAYCIEREEEFIPDIEVTMNIRAGIASEVDDGIFTNNLVENIDAINWLLNQDFTSQSNGDTSGNGAGENYTEAEIQHAIWGLSDGDSEFRAPEVANGVYNGTQENVDELLALALENGDGFVAGEGDLMTLIFDPTEVQDGYDEDEDYDQAFLLTIAYDDLLQVCDCSPIDGPDDGLQV